MKEITYTIEYRKNKAGDWKIYEDGFVDLEDSQKTLKQFIEEHPEHDFHIVECETETIETMWVI
jgi:hypothetical protein